ncbi:MAG TPA: glycerate kinase [Candidatus Dormibacteraeota bacterium]
MRFVAAPNAFKGSLTAPEAAAAISRGIRAVFTDVEVLEVPIADGGDGTVAALVAARRGELRQAEVEGPLGAPVDAAFGLIDGGGAAVVELASASGLTLLAADRLDPLRASTFGFGQLLEAARRAGATRIIAGIGGSATNDGGAGMAQALGYRLLDESGAELPRGAQPLARLARIDAAGLDPAWRKIRVEVATDVRNPLCGPDGATAVYGPQKGVAPEMVSELDSALAHLADVVARDLGIEVAELAGAGAAGGTGAGLAAFLHATLEPGAPLVVEASGFDAALLGAACVFTGEGAVDRQTLFGKAPIEVARRARAAGVPTVLLAGSLGEGWREVYEHGVDAVQPISEGPASLESLEASAGALLERAAERACRLLAVSLKH